MFGIMSSERQLFTEEFAIKEKKDNGISLLAAVVQ